MRQLILPWSSSPYWAVHMSCLPVPARLVLVAPARALPASCHLQVAVWWRAIAACLVAPCGAVIARNKVQAARQSTGDRLQQWHYC